MNFWPTELWDVSTWSSTFLVVLILVTIAFGWLLPAAAWGMFRVINRKGSVKVDDEAGDFHEGSGNLPHSAARPEPMPHQRPVTQQKRQYS